MPTPYNGHYVSNADLINEGIDSSVNTDSVIKQAERLIEMWCFRWFYQRINTTLTLDGGDHYFPFFGFAETTDLLFIPVPYQNLTAVSVFGINHDISNIIQFTRIGPPRDDRWNPRIISKLHLWPLEGVQNIALTGDFGFIEDATDPTSTPEPIKIAARKLAIRLLPRFKMTDPEREMDQNQSYLQSEEVVGYKYKFVPNFRNEKNPPVYSGDREIDDIVEYYRYKRYVMAV